MDARVSSGERRNEEYPALVDATPSPSQIPPPLRGAKAETGNPERRARPLNASGMGPRLRGDGVKVVLSVSRKSSSHSVSRNGRTHSVSRKSRTHSVSRKGRRRYPGSPSEGSS